jgi:hypothetical protein
MKICIIGFPRSRSSILLEAISNFYNIPIIGSTINQFLNDKGVLNSHGGNILLKNCLRAKTGVIRLHPLQLMDKTNKYEFINFDLLEFKQYDKIYFTERDAIDTIASECVAYTLKKYTYTSPEELVKDIPSIKITNEHRNLIKEHVHSENLVRDLKQYLTINNIFFEELWYDKIPEYLEVNFPTASTSHIKTNYNYRQIIEDYNDIRISYNYYKL